MSPAVLQNYLMDTGVGCPQQPSPGHVSHVGGCSSPPPSLTWSKVLSQICKLWSHCIVCVYHFCWLFPLKTSLSVFSLTKIDQLVKFFPKTNNCNKNCRNIFDEVFIVKSEFQEVAERLQIHRHLNSRI